MRVVYSLLFYLLTPFILLRLVWRGIKAPEYLNRWRERFASYDKQYPQHDIWFHAVSVGETEALFPLVKRLQQEHPELKLLITTTTPTGSARVKAVLQETVTHVYLPYDLPGAVSRFVRCFKPRLAVIVETEIWPNLFACCGANQIPLTIINARLSEKSARGYQKIPTLVRPALAQVKHIAAQTEQDAERFIAIGAQKQTVEILGNIKFDLEIAQGTIEQGQQLKATQFAGRFVLLIASTHKDEEAPFVDIYRQLKQTIPELLLVVVPRHPERFDPVKKLFEQQQLTIVTRTSQQQCQPETDVYLVDTMGELKMLYAAADVAFVGGSLVPRGGHNILEASAVGVPVLFGPFMNNFKEIAGAALTAGAALQCQNEQDIVQAVLTIYRQPDFKLALVEKGKAFVLRNRGATDAVYARLMTTLYPSLKVSR